MTIRRAIFRVATLGLVLIFVGSACLVLTFAVPVPDPWERYRERIGPVVAEASTSTGVTSGAGESVPVSPAVAGGAGSPTARDVSEEIAAARDAEAAREVSRRAAASEDSHAGGIPYHRISGATRRSPGLDFAPMLSTVYTGIGVAFSACALITVFIARATGMPLSNKRCFAVAAASTVVTMGGVTSAWILAAYPFPCATLIAALTLACPCLLLGLLFELPRNLRKDARFRKVILYGVALALLNVGFAVGMVPFVSLFSIAKGYSQTAVGLALPVGKLFAKYFVFVIHGPFFVDESRHRRFTASYSGRQDCVVEFTRLGISMLLADLASGH